MTPQEIPEASVREAIAPLLNAALPQGSHLAITRQYRWSTHFIYEGQNADRGKPGQRILVKVIRDRDAAGRRQSAATPGYRAAAEYQALSLFEKVVLLAGDARLTAIHPFGYCSEVGAVVMEYRPARDLRALVRDAARLTARRADRDRVERAAASAGKLLALIHERLPADVVYSAKAPMAERLRTLRGEGTTSVAGLDELEAALVTPAEPAPAWVGLHGDLYPDNVMLDDEGRVFLLDTGLEQVGSAMEDLAKFVVGTETLKERLVLGDMLVRSEVLQSVTSVFVRGYSAVRPVDPRELASETVLAGLQRQRELAAASAALRFPGAGLVARRVDASMRARLQTYLTKWSRECR